MVPLETLKDLSFLHGLAEGHLRQIASVAQPVDYPPGTVVFREGQTRPFVFLVLQGKVSLEVCIPGRGCLTVLTVGPGELLGWSPLLETGPMTATARAAGPCRLLAINGAQLLALCEHDPRLGMEFMRRTARALAQRINGTRLQLLDVYRHELQPAAGGEGDP